jgi:hypothetical protein
MAWLSRHLDFLRRLVQTFGPYLLVEILLPGGTLIALLLYLRQHGKLAFGRQSLARVWIGRRA